MVSCFESIDTTRGQIENIYVAIEGQEIVVSSSQRNTHIFLDI